VDRVLSADGCALLRDRILPRRPQPVNRNGPVFLRAGARFRNVTPACAVLPIAGFRANDNYSADSSRVGR